MVYDPSSPDHLVAMDAITADQPCYSYVVREVEGAYYLCIDCCFERTELSGAVMFNHLPGTGRIAKGTGEFNPTECRECSNNVPSVP